MNLPLPSHFDRLTYLEAFFNKANLGMCIFDCDLKFVQINETLAQMNGLPVAEHLGKAIADVLPTLAPILEPVYQQVLATGVPTSLDYSGHQAELGTQHWSASCFPLLEDNTFMGLGAIVVDITAKIGELTLKEVNQDLENRLIERTRQLNQTIQDLQNEIASRQQIQQQLIENEEKYRLLVETSQDMIWSVDATGRYTFVNSAVREIYGYEPEEMIGRLFTDFEPPEQIAKDLEVYQRILAGESYFKYETIQIAKDGRRLNLLFNAVVQRDSEGNAVGNTGTASDITESKGAELALKRSEELYRTLVNSFPDGAVFLYDHHLRYLLAGGTELKQTGIDSKNIEGRNALGFWQAKDRQRVKPLYQAALAGQTAEGEFPWGENIYHLKTLPVRNQAGEIFAGMLVAQNITARKQAETQLQQTQNFLQSVLHHLPVSVFVKEAQELRFVLWNTASTELQGFTPEDVIGKNDYDFFPQEQADWFTSKDREVLNSGKVLDIPEEVVQTTQGDKIFHTKKAAILDTFGNPAYLLGIAEDITERKLSERALQESKRQLEQTLEELTRTQTQVIQSEKMSSLGQLVAGVAHEINNPVNFIYGNITPAREYISDLLHLLQLYQTEYPEATPIIKQEIEKIELDFLIEDLPNIINSMQVGASRIQEIVLSLRNFSRMDEAQIKNVDIHTGIDSTLSLLQNRTKAKAGCSEITIVKQYGKLPLVECYAGQLNQVFMNLLVNALDALEERSHSDPQHRDLIKIETSVINSQFISISIFDNGKGIPESAQAKLFDPFFTTKAVGKGTGLGLAISYQIVVERHLGRLYCQSVPGEGTKFIIEIPIRLS